MIKTKKLISIVLVFTLIISMFAMGTASVSATEGTEVFLQNTVGWTAVKAVTAEQTVDASLVDGTENVYKAVIDPASASIKFTNADATEQTAEIADPTDGNIFLTDKNDKTVSGGVTTYNGKVDEYKVRNVIYMIGDGMGAEHIKTGNLYLGEEMAMLSMPYNTMVTTTSLSGVTDSAAAATAMATGQKTTNDAVGVLKDGNTKIENLNEFAQQRNMKSGVIVTQKVVHATPAGFTAHVSSRYSYSTIAAQQLKYQYDLILGGGADYFTKWADMIPENNYELVTDVAGINNVDPNKNVLGLFANDYISADDSVKLKDLTTQGLERLTNDNGFFVMIEGSDIDSKAHLNEMYNMCKELEVFNDSIKVAKQYVNEHPDTLLIVTADHETGDLKLPSTATKNDLISSTGNSYFKSKDHTGVDVPLYAMGARAWELCDKANIDNTDAYKLITKALNETYGEAETKDFTNHDTEKIYFELPQSWSNAYVQVKGAINGEDFPGTPMVKLENYDNIYELNLYEYAQLMQNQDANEKSPEIKERSLIETGARSFIRGDADQNGKINIRDCTAIQKHILEYIKLSADGLYVADVDDNGAINIRDATHIQKYLLKYDNPYNVGELIEEPVTTISSEPTESKESSIISSSEQESSSSEPESSITEPQESSSSEPESSITEPQESSSSEPESSSSSEQESSASSEQESSTQPDTKPDLELTFVFNDGTDSQKTVEVNFDGYRKLYKIDQGEDTDSATGHWIDFIPDAGVIYFEKPESWKDAYFYTWGSCYFGVWPGTKMEHVEDNIYQLILSEDNFMDDILDFGIVFSDGLDTYQTADLSFIGYNKIFKVLGGENTKKAYGAWYDYGDSEEPIVGNPLTVYLKDETSWDITTDGAIIAVKCDKNDYIEMTKIGDKLWSAEIKDNYSAIMFQRINPDGTEAVWNSFAPATPRGTNNMYTVTSSSAGKWSTYTPPATDPTEASSVDISTDPTTPSIPTSEPSSSASEPDENAAVIYCIPEDLTSGAPSGNWLSNSYFIRANVRVDNNTTVKDYIRSTFSDTGKTINGKKVFSATLSHDSEHTYKMQIQAYSDSGFSSSGYIGQYVTVNDKWTSFSSLDGKLYTGSSWETPAFD